jgi:hypothetical protein
LACAALALAAAARSVVAAAALAMSRLRGDGEQRGEDLEVGDRRGDPAGRVEAGRPG